ncbi:MAG: beta-phosphoglucomutase family hydrolase [Actinomycetota bacterium]|nr:beta-phosphoglucomutase family hydrolase [Actinomycetota bacterium]
MTERGDEREPAAARPPDGGRWRGYTAVLFDLDGVLTPTAELHQRAWTEMFEGFLGRHIGPDHAPYTEADYLAYVDGKPRFDGVRSFLGSRGIELPEGNPADPPGDGSVAALGNRKNGVFLELVRADGIRPYPGSLRFLDHLEALGVGSAVVSSSRNAGEVLAAAGLTPRFPVLVDGEVAAREHIAGKPAPDMFLAAASALGAAAAEAVVVEDAVSGVAAGHAGGFGLVVGVDRGAGRTALEHAGADIVIDDLVELLTTDDVR